MPARTAHLLLAAAVLFICVPACVAASLTGLILDAANAPLSDAAISVFSSGQDWQIRSNHDGHFAIAGLPAGLYSLEVRRPGFRKLIMGDISLSGDESRTLTLNLRICNTGCDEGCGPDPVVYEASEKADRLLATVLSQGRPVRGAELALRSPHASGPPLRTLTNADGGAEMDNVPPGQYVLTISASGYQTTTLSDVRLLTHRATTVMVDLLPNGMIRVCQ